VDFVAAFVPKIKSFYGVVGDISVLIFSGLMAWAGVSKLQSLALSNQLSPAMEIPMVYCYLALEVGFALCVIRSVQSLVMRALGRIDEMSPEEEDEPASGREEEQR
jgi:TRAP-type C4-dicarboxylate transport system permease small subunit